MNTKVIAITALILSTLVLGTIQAQDTPEKQKGVICETMADCQKLSQSIQTQVDELEAKGNLTTDDKRLRYQLRKKLIALENRKQKLQKETIARENQKQNQLMNELRNILLDK